MTHDPLCPVGVKPWEDTYCCQKCSPGETPPWERACQCDLIAKVRTDERQQAEARVETLRDSAGVITISAAAALAANKSWRSQW